MYSSLLHSHNTHNNSKPPFRKLVRKVTVTKIPLGLIQLLFGNSFPFFWIRNATDNVFESFGELEGVELELPVKVTVKKRPFNLPFHRAFILSLFLKQFVRYFKSEDSTHPVTNSTPIFPFLSRFSRSGEMPEEWDFFTTIT
ncbi:hypothetical protein NPIL_183291 [Nephila pilipes]|uniref:Uncharacterized protein n=1 Tax=Nephila pilipes TaxID=299642 RepID=A0A8X6N4M4_NEPPI|nr:hypothetical protein NPIL_183291 [Nephila pilipes]